MRQTRTLPVREMLWSSVIGGVMLIIRGVDDEDMAIDCAIEELTIKDEDWSQDNIEVNDVECLYADERGD